MDKISIIIPTLGREKELKKCIDSLKKQTLKCFEIIVVSKKKIKQAGIKTIIQKGKGASNARNIGIAEAKEDLLLFLDDDVILEEDYVEQLMKFWSKYEKRKIGGVTGKITNSTQSALKTSFVGKLMKSYAKIFEISGFFTSTVKIGKIYKNGFTASNFDKIDKIQETDFLSGCNMLVSKKILEKHKILFDETLIGNCYFEDVDFSFSIKEKGYLIFAISFAKLQHVESSTTRANLAKLKYYYLINQKKFVHKHREYFDISSFYLARFALCLPVVGYGIASLNFELIFLYFKAMIQ